MEEWIAHTINALGYTGIFFLMWLENIVLVIPSEIIIPMTGFISSTGEINLYLTIIVIVAGTVAGSMFWFYLARWWGKNYLLNMVARWGKYLFIKNEDVIRAIDWFDVHGVKAVFFARFVPGLRTLIAMAAGFSNIRVSSFILYSVAGIVIWTVLLAYLGYFLHSKWQLITYYSTIIGWVLLGLFVTAATTWILWRLLRKKQ